MNALINMPGSSIAELTPEELDLIGGGATTMVMVMECTIDENGDGTCTVKYSEKEDN
ncbi:MAG TPA: hypothetical protein VEA61_09265 [Allosphingosinicella sp.]|nr:hypothetical protein [Allosphingosinicella sp.]